MEIPDISVIQFNSEPLLCSLEMFTKSVILVLSFLVVTLATPPGRIISGSNSDIRKYPFIISLRSTSGSHSCGGSIISSKWILTAAHCVDGRTAKGMTIQYGLTNVDRAGPNIAVVKRFIMHENYDNQKITDDIALLELQGRLIFNYKSIAPVALPKKNFETQQTQAGQPGVLLGWGTNITGGKIVEHLQEAELKVYSDKECADRHGESVTPNNICGGIDEGWKGQCSGDSGGPLILQDGHVQVGIVSWSVKPCQVPPYPGVLTKVSHYIDWIEKNTNA